jgi:hypothetical protein
MDPKPNQTNSAVLSAIQTTESWHKEITMLSGSNDRGPHDTYDDPAMFDNSFNRPNTAHYVSKQDMQGFKSEMRGDCNIDLITDCIDDRISHIQKGVSET